MHRLHEASPWIATAGPELNPAAGERHDSH
jgi:hypothetical protein